jgi:hypothetical protein
VPMTMTSTAHKIKIHKDPPLAAALAVVGAAAGALSASEDVLTAAAGVAGAAAVLLSASEDVLAAVSGVAGAAAGLAGSLRERAGSRDE